MLRSCKKNPSLRRVVLTSSTSAVRARDDFDPKIPLDESSWSSVEFCERLQVTSLSSESMSHLILFVSIPCICSKLYRLIL